MTKEVREIKEDIKKLNDKANANDSKISKMLLENIKITGDISRLRKKIDNLNKKR